MKNKEILFLSLFFIIALVLAPTIVKADDGDTINNNVIYVGGIEMKSGEYLAKGAVAVESNKPENDGYAYYKDGVLTLNNYNYVGEGFLDTSSYVLVYSEKDLKIVINGDNTLTQTNNDEYSKYNGISVKGKLEIEGTGKLNIKSDYTIVASDGIKISDSDLILDSGEVGISSNNIEISDGSINIISEPFHGISSSDGNIIISGGALEINAYYPIFNPSGNITISGGTLNLTTNETRGDGISTYSSGTIKITGGIINIDACEHGIIAGNIYGYGANEDTKLIISEGVINIKANNGIRASFSDINISGGNLNIKTDDYGVYSEKNLNFTGGKLLVDVPTGKKAILCNGEVILGNNIKGTSNDDLKQTNHIDLVSIHKVTFDVEEKEHTVEVNTDMPNYGDEVIINVTPAKAKEVDNIIILDSNGNEIKIIKNADGNYSYIQPNSNVEISVTFKDKEVKTYKVVFDANKGTFKDGKTLTIEKWENGMEDTIEEPTRDGYKFLGFFTKATDGTKLELILAESGIDDDVTFYAQWEENSGAVPPTAEGENQPDSNDKNAGNNGNINTNNNKPTLNNPQTGDDIWLFTLISVIAAVGLAIAIKVKKYVK